jgi:hypothetical protein
VSDTDDLSRESPEPLSNSKHPKRSERAKQKKKPLSKGENRAIRLREARPELASQIGKSISIPEAVKIGGYEDGADMHNKVMGILHAIRAKSGKTPKKKNKPKSKAA